MDKHTYMRQFAWQVRWRLPKAEADGILADYEELLGQRLADQDADLVQDLGSPHQAARLLTERKPYYSWLILFCGMVCCLLLPTVMLLRTAFFQASTVSMALLLLLGMSACLVQFHPHPGIRKTPVPKALLFSLLGLIAVLAAVGWMLGCLISGAWTHWPPEWYGMTAHWTLSLAGIVGAACGVLGLVRARISDRRWSALYILGLTVLVVCVMIHAFLGSLVITDLWTPYVVKWGVLGAVGFVGTGVSLC